MANKTIKYKYHEFLVEVQPYVKDTNSKRQSLALAILLTDIKTQDIYRLTTNLGNRTNDESLLMPGCTFVDINNDLFKNVKEAISFCEKFFKAEPYTRFGYPIIKSSGFVSYPCLRFDADILRQFDEAGLQKYMNQWTKTAPKEQEAMQKDFENEYESRG